ncbi:MAG: hypothetical protein AB7Q23_17115 [Hyphomonadaceae bacterium]
MASTIAPFENCLNKDNIRPGNFSQPIHASASLEDEMCALPADVEVAYGLIAEPNRHAAIVGAIN